MKLVVILGVLIIIWQFQLYLLHRLFMGRNKVMAVGLGRTKESEHKTNLHKLATMLVGKRGLLFTNENTETVNEWFGDHKRFCFARSGSVATGTVELPSGPLDLPHSMEPQLRLLGLPTRLKDGECYHKMKPILISLIISLFSCPVLGLNIKSKVN